MTRVFRLTAAFVLGALWCLPAAFGARVSAIQLPSGNVTPARCVAVPLPSVRGAEGNATDLATAVRDLAIAYLNGPSMRTVPLDARLAEHALEEARLKNCPAVLTITVTRKTSGGGVFGRALGQAAGAAAWHMPSGGSAARGAAIAGTAAVSSITSNTRAKDEFQIEYRLSDGGSTRLEGRDKAKAKADGEDLLTPLIERMAGAIAKAVAP